MRLSENPSEKGFTLIELLVGLSILGIVTAIAAPSMSTMIENGRLSEASSSLATAMRLAKTESVSRLVTVTICRSNAAGTNCNTGGKWRDGWIVFTDADRDFIVDAEDTILRVQPSFHTALQTHSNLGGNQFIPSGTVRYPKMYVQFKSAQGAAHHKYLFLGLNGRPTQQNASDHR